ncbi:MAG: hypothetical protein ACKO96_10250, partial [Flammeovirgaceae bacterium]
MMRPIRFTYMLCLSLFSLSAMAQNGEYVPAVNIPVTHNGTAIANPWVGGFNAPIFSEIDMNGDGYQVIDRERDAYGCHSRH